MRLIGIAILALGLLSAGLPTSAAAQSPEVSPGAAAAKPSASEPSSQRIAITEAGLAVSFPPEWAVDVRTVPFSQGSVLPAPDVKASILVNAYLPGSLVGCRVSLWQGVDTTPEEFAEWQAGLASPPLPVTAASLPVGDAYRIDASAEIVGEPDWAAYVLGLRGDIVQLTCLGQDRPVDRWLSIAATIEVVPIESPLPPIDGAMELEGVEPHVVRVLDDGAGHDLTDLDTFEDPKPVSLIALGEDGSVWLTSSGGFIELGTPGEVSDPLETFLAQMDVGPDGSLAIADGYRGSSIGRLHSGSWKIHELPSNAWVVWLDAKPGGGLDFAWRDESTLTFGALPELGGDLSVALLPPPLQLASPDGHIDVARTLDGRLWVAEGPWWWDEERFESGPLWMFEGTSWQRVEPPAGDVPAQPRELAVDGSGRLWITWLQVEPGTSDIGVSYLTRLDEDGSWTAFSDSDAEATGGFLVAGEESVWFTPGWCEGYARFDGREMTRYLDGLCVRSAGISPTGDVWIFGLCRNRDDAGVYVIRP